MKKWLALFATVCLLASCIGAVTAFAESDPLNTEKISELLLKAIENAEETTLIPVVLRYEKGAANEELLETVAAEIAAEVIGARGTLPTGTPATALIPYDRIRATLETYGLSYAETPLLTQMETEWTETIFLSESLMSWSAKNFLRYRLYEHHGEAFAYTWSIPQDNVLLCDKMEPVLVVKLTTAQIARLSADESILSMGLGSERHPAPFEEKYYFPGDESKVTSALLTVLADTADDFMLSIYLWYQEPEAIENVQQVAHVIASDVSRALADKTPVSYDGMRERLCDAGLGEFADEVIPKIEALIDEYADFSAEKIVTEVYIMAERWLYMCVNNQASAELMADLGVDPEQVSFQSQLAPMWTLTATAADIARFTMDERVTAVDLYRESHYVEAPDSILLGDANNDGVVNLKDVLTVRKFLIDFPIYIRQTEADVNHDNALNMKDVLALRQIVLYGNVYARTDSVPYVLEEFVTSVGGSEEFCATFPKAAILRSSAEVDAYFAKTEGGNLFSGTTTPVSPKNTYDDAFFADKFLVALRVDDQDIDYTTPISGVYRVKDGSLVLHSQSNWAYSPWTAQDVALISLPRELLGSFSTVYEIRRIPMLNDFSLEIEGYRLEWKGRYVVQ